MASIVIQISDKKEQSFVTQLLKKLGIKSTVVSDSEAEDLEFSALLKNINPKDTVSEEEILNKLWTN